MTGEVGILNVGAGDTKLSFDPTKPDEVKRSAKIVKDMLRRGYVLLVEVGRDDNGPLYRRATAFDESTHEYIVAGLAEDAPEEEPEHVEKPASAPRPRRQAKAAPAKRRVAAAATNAVAVARTAGG